MRFTRSLAWRRGRWLVGCPPAIGLATLKACLKLWLGFSPKTSGVFSAGNGPCARAPILGVALGNQPELLREFVRRATRITHTDPRAEQAALAVAWSAHLSASGVAAPHDVAGRLAKELGETAAELVSLIRQAASSVEAGQTTESFVADLKLGRGVTGFVLHTIPAVLHAWMRYPDDYAAAVQASSAAAATPTRPPRSSADRQGHASASKGSEAWRTGWPVARNLRQIARLGRELCEGS